MNTSQHQRDIRNIIYLERIIYASLGTIEEREILNAIPDEHSLTREDVARLLTQYSQRNSDPHHQHWHREELSRDVVYLSKPAPFEPF